MSKTEHPPITIKCADQPSAFILGWIVKMVDDGVLGADGFKSWKLSADEKDLTLIIRKSPELQAREAEREEGGEGKSARRIRRDFDGEMSDEDRRAEYAHEARMERESERLFIRRKYGWDSA